MISRHTGVCYVYQNAYCFGLIQNLTTSQYREDDATYFDDRYSFIDRR